MRKSVVTRELVNTFPTWSRVRLSEQSLGFQYLNAIARPIEDMDRELSRMQSNIYLNSANLDEIDITYRVFLPKDYDFEEENTDIAGPGYLAPTVSGLVDSTWVDVSLADDNDIKSFWYAAVPARVTLESTASGVSHISTYRVVEDMPASGLWDHYLDAGYWWVTASGGTRYLDFDEDVIRRGKVIITGTTRKGTEESETLIFPWDMKQRTQKEWEQITNLEAFDMEDSVLITLNSADYTQPPYLSHWNARYSENRNKIDEFWALGTVSGLCTIDLVGYISDEWQSLVDGMVETEVKQSWELIDNNGSNVVGVDLAIQPFTDNAWVVTADAQLYCYDLLESTVSGISRISSRTPGPYLQIELEKSSFVLGEPIQFIPWHARPLKEINKYRIWYETPSGTKYGLDGGTQVAYTENFWQWGSSTVSRTLEPLISIPTLERGDYLLVLETIFVDGEEQEDRVIVPVQYKSPTASFDLSSYITDTVSGIDFDADQKLWIQGSLVYYQIGLHSDLMLIDYAQKVIYFREDYDEVEIGD